MSIASEITRLQGAKNTLKTKLNAKNDAQHQIDDETLDEYGDFVDSIPTGGGGGAVEEKDVNFYDYDGTLLHSYTKSDFLALTEMPENPTHTGLTAQGWNWDLSDAKDYVTEYGVLDIGQTYTTASGLSEFDIELTPATGLTVTLNIDGTKNWGDGTSDDLTSHTYLTTGGYTITSNGTTLTTTSNTYNICNDNVNSSQENQYMRNIRIANITSIPGGAFCAFKNIKSIIISNTTTTFNASAFYGSFIKHFTFPKNIPTSTDLPQQIFANCTYLKSISFSKNIRLAKSTTNKSQFQGCNNLKRVIIPTNYTIVSETSYSGCYKLKFIDLPSGIKTVGKNAFNQCYSIEKIDFTKCSSIPTLDYTNAFTKTNKLFTKIVVPDSLYTDWIAETNWTAIAGFIIKESDYNAS